MTNKSYAKIDTLLVSNFALYNSKKEVLLMRNQHPSPVNIDSVLAVFESWLGKLGLENLNIDFANNVVDSALYYGYVVKLKHLDDTYLRSIVDTTSKSAILVPIIIANNDYRFVSYFTSGGGFGGGGWNTITWLHLIVYIFKDQEVVYSRHYRYKSIVIQVESKGEAMEMPPLTPVKQEHWDELVRLAMKDYIERLK